MHAIIQEDIKKIIGALGDDAKKLEGKTLLISGGAGFLGSYFVATISELNKKFAKPCKVIILDNYITGSKKSLAFELLDNNISLVEADITKPLKIDQPVDYIVHMAGLASPAYYQKFPLETIDAAIMGAKNLLELAKEKKATSYLGFSSSEIYGDPHPDSIPTPETYNGNVSTVGPRACYDESKRLAETISMTYWQVHDVPVKIVRPFNVYGPGMKPNDFRVVPNFVVHGLLGKPLTVFNKGNQTRTFCYISDAVTGFYKVLLSGRNGETYNVGSDGPEINMVALATMVSGLFEHPVPIELIEYPSTYPGGEPNRRCPDLTKIRTQLSHTPTVELKEGLSKTITWLRDTLPSDFKLD